MLARFRAWLSRVASATATASSRWRILVVAVAILLVPFFALSWYWSREPSVFWVSAATQDRPLVLGYSTTDTLIQVATWLLEKPGGYLTNDIMLPGIWLDNMPSFEFGVVVQIRDLARVLRNDYSRSQSQSTEDPDLAVAEPAFNFDNDSWIFPPTESEYRRGMEAVQAFRVRLSSTTEPDAQFYARADNLREWLAVVERRLGSLSQRLSASVGQVRVNTDLAGEPSGGTATPRPSDIPVKTPWLQIDNVFYEARGTAWALVHFLRAAQFDFQTVLEDKNAVVSMRQIIRELEGALAPVRSPIILNGGGFGLTANHSLVLASYLSRANAAAIDLRGLLEQG